MQDDRVSPFQDLHVANASVGDVCMHTGRTVPIGTSTTSSCNRLRTVVNVGKGVLQTLLTS